MACCSAPLPCHADDLQAFFGHFAGHSLDAEGEDIARRDFDVTIEAADATGFGGTEFGGTGFGGTGFGGTGFGDTELDNTGFWVSWRTLIYGDGGIVRKKDYSINFCPTDRDGIYAPAGKTDMFDAKTCDDPIKDEACTWAVVSNRCMTIYDFTITHEGGYEIQACHRTLTDFGMDLAFSRCRDGAVFKNITGTLRRIDGDQESQDQADWLHRCA